MIQLVLPAVELANSWRASVAEFPLGAVLHGFGYDDQLDLPLDTATGFAEFVQSLRDAERGVGLPQGWVACTTLWIIDSGEPNRVLGSLALRHNLENDFLAEYGGHLGYGVRPSARGRGIASAALQASFPHARARGLERILVTCDDSNSASRRTIESGGGVFERMAGQRRRYWITT
ncbi:MAG: GNAT family N-acetyltransferase [Allobranchiibius sp.]